MKTKDQTYYQKLVIGGQWKKVAKVISGGSQQEKDWILETLGTAAARSDDYYNHLVEILQNAPDQATKVSAVKAMGNTARSGAMSQLEFVANHTEDAEVQEALAAARHALKAAIK